MRGATALSLVPPEIAGRTWIKSAGKRRDACVRNRHADARPLPLAAANNARVRAIRAAFAESAAWVAAPDLCLVRSSHLRIDSLRRPPANARSAGARPFERSSWRPRVREVRGAETHRLGAGWGVSAGCSRVWADRLAARARRRAAQTARMRKAPLIPSWLCRAVARCVLLWLGFVGSSRGRVAEPVLAGTRKDRDRDGEGRESGVRRAARRLPFVRLLARESRG